MIESWLAEAWRTFMQRDSRAALPHALLIAGPAGIGKRAFAAEIVAALLCGARAADGRACGSCRGCALRLAGSHPDLIQIGIPEDKTQILVDQIRGLSQRLALTPQLGGRQIALIDPADAMNDSAYNALLKTLEEPTPDTLLVLISDRAERLPATIRSRCQRINCRVPGRSAATEWLARAGFSSHEAEQALDLAGDNPGQARQLIESGLLPLCDAVQADLDALHAGRARALDLANAWARDRPELRWYFAANLAHARMRRLVDESDSRLTVPGYFTKLATWFDEANRARDSLRTTLRAELTALNVLQAWCALAPSPTRR